MDDSDCNSCHNKFLNILIYSDIAGFTQNVAMSFVVFFLRLLSKGGRDVA